MEGVAMSKNTFSVSMNCYTWGKFDVAQCLEQIQKTPIRMVELPAEQTRPGSLIPELMVDEPLGGDWRHSIADLKTLLAKDGFQAEAIAVIPMESLGMRPDQRTGWTWYCSREIRHAGRRPIEVSYQGTPLYRKDFPVVIE